MPLGLRPRVILSLLGTLYPIEHSRSLCNHYIGHKQITSSAFRTLHVRLKFREITQPSTQPFSSRSNYLARNFVTLAGSSFGDVTTYFAPSRVEWAGRERLGTRLRDQKFALANSSSHGWFDMVERLKIAILIRESTRMLDFFGMYLLLRYKAIGVLWNFGEKCKNSRITGNK